MSGDDREVVIYVQEGLGNQLFQYACARAFALRGDRTLKLDLRHYLHPNNRPYKLDLFQIQGSAFTPGDRLRLAMNNSPKLARYRLMLQRLASPHLYTIFRDPQAGFDPAMLRSDARRVYLSGFWQCERYFVDAADVIRRELRFKQPPDADNEQMLQQIGSVDAVSLHVRRGDYVGAARYGALIGHEGERYYRTAVDMIRQRVGNPHFFVFSDDPRWARDHLPFVEPRTLVSHNTGARDHEDLRLMNACRHFIIANSSFSWWGAWLSPPRENAQQKIVIAPRRWFAGGQRTNEIASENRTDEDPMGRDIVPAGWTRI